MLKTLLNNKMEDLVAYYMDEIIELVRKYLAKEIDEKKFIDELEDILMDFKIECLRKYR